MKKKVIGALAGFVILAGIIGSHHQTPPSASVHLTSAEQQTTTTTPSQPTAPTQPDTQAQSVPTPPATPPPPVASSTPAASPSSSCNPNYDPCVPNSASDLDCPDIGRQVSVIGTDVYRLDADHDGTGCDSY